MGKEDCEKLSGVDYLIVFKIIFEEFQDAFELRLHLVG